MDLVDRLCPEDWYTQQRAAFRKAIAEKSNMYELILRVYQLDPEVRKTFFKNFIINASLKGSQLQEDHGLITVSGPRKHICCSSLVLDLDKMDAGHALGIRFRLCKLPGPGLAALIRLFSKAYQLSVRLKQIEVYLGDGLDTLQGTLKYSI